jgi:hypothetical protein
LPVNGSAQALTAKRHIKAETNLSGWVKNTKQDENRLKRF